MQSSAKVLETVFYRCVDNTPVFEPRNPIFRQPRSTERECSSIRRNIEHPKEREGPLLTFQFLGEIKRKKGTCPLLGTLLAAIYATPVNAKL